MSTSPAPTDGDPADAPLARAAVAIQGRRVLVIGGAGFIGSHLVDRLLAAGAEVRVLDDLTSGHRRNLAAAADRIDLHVASIEEPEAVAAAMEGVHAAVHLAAMVSVPESVAEPVRCHRLNVQGTAHVLAAARAAGVHSLVLASSSAVYGGDPALPSRETDPIHCESPYAASKAAAEALVLAAGRTSDLVTTSLRFFNVFGTRQDPNSPYAAVIAAFADAVAAGRPPKIFGDGQQTRDFIPVHDVTAAILLAMVRDRGDDGGLVCNVGTGVRRSLLDVLDDLVAASGAAAMPPTFEATRAGDVPHSGADVSAAREHLGFEAEADVAGMLGAVLAEARTAGASFP